MQQEGADRDVLREVAEASASLGTAVPGGSQKDIRQAWLAFVEQGSDPHLSSAVKPEIADSWVRCRAMGVDPRATMLVRSADDEIIAKTRDAYEQLVEIAKPLMGIIENLGLSNDYLFELISFNGITLIYEGNLGLHPYIARLGIFDEDTCGTNAHSLCMRHKTSIQVVGCEHYCEPLHVLAAEAAPVMDENGVVIAALLLTQPLPDDSDAPAYRKLLSHALGLVTSIASTVEQRLRFMRVSHDLGNIGERYERKAAQAAKTQHILDMTVSASSDPILIADARGVVSKVSPEAAKILGRSSIDAVGSTVESLLDVSWEKTFGKLFSGSHSASAKVFVRGRGFMLRGTSIEGSADGEIGGVLLRLEERSRGSDAQRSAVGESAKVTFDDILGESAEIATAKAICRRYALTSENVLIVGESGTGKELFAQAVHNESRPDGPFMSINCAAIPPRLIESELFGYESGAFTGAERGGKPGKIELANGGTLFLDEIGDMPLELQATLLRVLENKRVMRLGGKSYKQVDFRVVAATNRDLVSMVREGAFREDLLYRLSILTVELPPLRERNGDALFFARCYLDECRCKAPGGAEGFTPEAERFILGYAWPGNVRQLKNAVFSAYYATGASLIDVADFPSYALRTFERIGDDSERGEEGVGRTAGREAAIGEAARGASSSGAPDAPGAKDDVLAAIAGASHALSMAQMEEATIRLAMRIAKGNVRKASELLGISKATLYRKLKEFGLD